MWQYRPTEELYHYGIPGMKWGVRRANLKTAKQEYKKKMKRLNDEYDKTIIDIEKPYKRFQNLSDKDVAREEAAQRRFDVAASKAKAEYKAAKGQFKIDKKSKVALGVVGGTVAAGGILGAAFANKFFNKYGKQVFASSEIKLQTLAGGAKGAAFAALGMIGAYGVDSIASKARTSKNNSKRRTKHI